MLRTTDKLRPYLTGPDRSRLAPWFYALLAVALVVSWYVVDREPWIGPLFVLGGAAIAVQGVDALRTGRLAGHLPNRFNIHADRSREPVIFWLISVIYYLSVVWNVLDCHGDAYCFRVVIVRRHNTAMEPTIGAERCMVTEGGARAARG
jgi:hypothetical protein